jgi:hypothetical protein
MYSKIAKPIEKFTASAARKLSSNFCKAVILLFSCMDKQHQERLILC